MKGDNKMKSNILKYVAFGLLAMGFTTACTDDFDELNTDKHAATDKDMERDGKAVGSFFQQMINRTTVMMIGGDQDDNYSSTGAYQHQIGISADAYSGYIGHTASWAVGRYNGTYDFSKGDEWGNTMFKVGMVQVMPAWAQMKANAEKLGQKEAAALGDIVKVFAMHRVTDHYGPIPYVDYKLGAIGQKYDAQDKVYKKFFEELDNAIDVLTPLAQGGGTLLSDYDPIYGGDVTKWVQMANTLRLRLALRVVYADPALAQAEGEKSAANPVGFIEDADGRCEYRGANGTTITNPLWQQAYEWNEVRMSAPMDSYLNGYNDPRISIFFKPAAADNNYHGVRQGIFSNGANQAPYQGDNISQLNVSQNTPVLYMAAAESFFLRAEAALRGWNVGGTAKDFYEAGIRMSMTELGANGADAYITDATSTPAAFTDNAGNDNAAAPSQITIAWNDDDDFETNLERIIVQKWIANWGNSPEAWSEFRRTGYPKMFPVKYNYSNNAVNSNLQIRRMPYPKTEYNTNRDAVEAGVELLGGPDNCGTQLWWDKKTH